MPLFLEEELSSLSGSLDVKYINYYILSLLIEKVERMITYFQPALKGVLLKVNVVKYAKMVFLGRERGRGLVYYFLRPSCPLEVSWSYPLFPV